MAQVQLREYRAKKKKNLYFFILNSRSVNPMEFHTVPFEIEIVGECLSLLFEKVTNDVPKKSYEYVSASLVIRYTNYLKLSITGYV